MLLRESLTNGDIPRRDKVREAIIQQFEKEFAVLRTELSVSYNTDSTKNMLILLIMAGVLRTR
jgi:hypothetical protein